MILTRLRTWLRAINIRDPLEQQQSILVQTLLLTLITITVFGIPLPFLSALPFTLAVGVVGLVLIELPLYIVALVLLRRGHFSWAIILTSASIVLLCVGLLMATGTRSSGATMFTFALPIVFAGLLAGERGLLWSAGLSLIGITAVLSLEIANAPLVGFAAPSDANVSGVLSGFISVAVVLGIFVARFGRALRSALRAALEREREITEQRNELEQTVVARTTDLLAALDEVRAKAAAQAELLAEIDQQREVIRELSVPLLPVDAHTLVLPLVGALDSARLQALQTQALHAVEGKAIGRLILDISGVPLVDSQVALGLLNTVRAARLLGVEVGVAGIRPEVAQAIVGLGLEISEVRAYRDLEGALTDVR